MLTDIKIRLWGDVTGWSSFCCKQVNFNCPIIVSKCLLNLFGMFSVRIGMHSMQVTSGLPRNSPRGGGGGGKMTIKKTLHFLAPTGQWIQAKQLEYFCLVNFCILIVGGPVWSGLVVVVIKPWILLQPYTPRRHWFHMLQIHNHLYEHTIYTHQESSNVNSSLFCRIDTQNLILSFFVINVNVKNVLISQLFNAIFNLDPSSLV